MSRRIKARVVDAKYFPEYKSVALSLEEWETHRPLKTAQIPSASFIFGGKDVDREMGRLAELYKQFKYPLHVVEADPDPVPPENDIELPEPWMIPFFGAKTK